MSEISLTLETAALRNAAWDWSFLWSFFGSRIIAIKFRSFRWFSTLMISLRHTFWQMKFSISHPNTSHHFFQGNLRPDQSYTDDPPTPQLNTKSKDSWTHLCLLRFFVRKIYIYFHWPFVLCNKWGFRTNQTINVISLVYLFLKFIIVKNSK